ncbi:hypothetical protein TWF102_005888 [Orbilia oligospora]|uniref:JmjC domain-containing protein n=1 Tax=Orbilia oligospora TaxID=2813651 RepID=A0A7C8N4Y2_ORBOL|nr:hypothetical protein TWF102_005888 [Orbilia oligospora]KAF3108101.1 hypothetical protein TWF103_005660 [Orbilia oligospora]
MDKTKSSEALRTLLESYASLNYPPTSIEYLNIPPTPLAFHQIVSRNRPVIIRNAMADWPAYTTNKWTPEYLSSTMGDMEVIVAETPKGNADSIVTHEGTRYFVKPHTTSYPLTTFLSLLKSTTTDPNPSTVLYAQSQDSNLTSEYFPISQDIPPTIPWASIALSQRLPDATNIWIGNHHSVSSLHKDPYQNLYGVLLGTKIFYLVSPLGVAGVKEEKVRSATYVMNREGFDIIPDSVSSSNNSDKEGEEEEEEGGEEGEGMITWPSISLDDYFSLPESERSTPVEDVSDTDPWKWTKLSAPIRVEVKAGEMLYLPALWYHQVAQTVDEDEGVCVAVNYWYDMDFSGPFVSMVNYVRDMTEVVINS